MTIWYSTWRYNIYAWYIIHYVCGCVFHSAISVELYYIFSTLWGREQYTLYGILFVVYAILLSVTACISIALTYFQLSVEDYRWWWRSIFSAGWATIIANTFYGHFSRYLQPCFIYQLYLKYYRASLTEVVLCKVTNRVLNILN